MSEERVKRSHYLNLPVVFHLLQGITVTEGMDQVHLDSLTYRTTPFQDVQIEVKRAAGNLNLINGVYYRIYMSDSLNTGNDTSIYVFSNFSL